MKTRKSLIGLFIIAALSSCELEPLEEEASPTNSGQAAINEESSLLIRAVIFYRFRSYNAGFLGKRRFLSRI